MRRKVHADEKRYYPRTSASVDTHWVDTNSGGKQRGRDNAKTVDGRKRHIVFDIQGLLLGAMVTAASVDDATGATELFAWLEGQPISRVATMYADNKYHYLKLYAWFDENAAWEMSVIRRSKEGEGWQKLPVDRTDERTFAWLGRCRRLRKDPEKCVLSSESFI